MALLHRRVTPISQGRGGARRICPRPSGVTPALGKRGGGRKSSADAASGSVRPQRRQPTGLCARDSPGRNTGVGCRFLPRESQIELCKRLSGSQIDDVWGGKKQDLPVCFSHLHFRKCELPEAWLSLSHRQGRQINMHRSAFLTLPNCGSSVFLFLLVGLPVSRLPGEVVSEVHFWFFSPAFPYSVLKSRCVSLNYLLCRLCAPLIFTAIASIWFEG